VARKNMAGYPDAWGSTKVCVFIHTGPASYAAVVVASPPTGGDVVQAAEAGMKTFDFVNGDMTSDDGQFRVEVLSPNGNTAGNACAAVPTKTMLLRWIVVATGVEVAPAVNLAGRTVRLLGIGQK
jgi:hypothetical protein